MKDTKYKVKIWKFASDDGDDMTEHIVFRNANENSKGADRWSVRQ